MAGGHLAFLGQFLPPAFYPPIISTRIPGFPSGVQREWYCRPDDRPFCVSGLRLQEGDWLFVGGIAVCGASVSRAPASENLDVRMRPPVKALLRTYRTQQRGSGHARPPQGLAGHRTTRHRFIQIEGRNATATRSPGQRAESAFVFSREDATHTLSLSARTPHTMGRLRWARSTSTFRQYTRISRTRPCCRHGGAIRALQTACPRSPQDRRNIGI